MVRRPPVFGGGTGLSGGTGPGGGTGLSGEAGPDARAASELRIIQEDKFHIFRVFDVFIMVGRS